jgi:cytochrome c oxidase subunit 2
MKKWLVLSLVFAMMSILIACGSGNGKSSNQSNAPIEVSDDEIATGSFEIVASNWEFDQEYYAIRANEAIEVNVNSIEGVHGIEIVGTDYNNIVNNKPTSITVTEPGTYEIRCSIPCGSGHRTMITKLVVVA